MTDAFDSRPVVVGVDGSKSGRACGGLGGRRGGRHGQHSASGACRRPKSRRPRRGDGRGEARPERGLGRRTRRRQSRSRSSPTSLYGDAALRSWAPPAAREWSASATRAPTIRRRATAAPPQARWRKTPRAPRWSFGIEREPSPYRYEWIIAVLDESPDSHAVLRTAINEALLRKAAILALTSLVDDRADAIPIPARPPAAPQLDRYLERSPTDDDADILVWAHPMPDHIFERG